MKTEKHFAGALVAASLTLGAGAALADDVALFSDKGIWTEQLNEYSDAARDAIGIGLDHNAYPAADQYIAFIQSSLASGELPQMFTWWTGGLYRDIIDTGEVADLGALWDDAVASGEFDPGLREFLSIDGKVYGVPLHLSTWTAFYNKDHFETAGITSEPQTWDEFLEAAEKLKAAGISPFHATVQDGWRGFIWFQEIMIRTDPEAYAGLHTGEVAYDSDPVRNAFRIWADWYDKGYFTDPRSREEAADFARGEGAIYLMGDWVIGQLEARGMKAGEDFGGFIMPNMDASLPSSIIVEGAPIMLSKEGAENPDVVAALKHFMSLDGANVWAEVSGNAIGNLKANSPNAVVEKINADMAERGTLALDRWWEAVPSDLQSDFAAEFAAFMLDPTMDNAEEIMARMQEANAEYWADQ